MNNHERQLISRVQDCLHRMANMSPSNSCDTKRIFARFPALVGASRSLYLAISQIGFRDYDDASRTLDEAEEIISSARLTDDG